MEETEYNPEEAKIKPYLFNKTFYLRILKSTNFIQGINQINSLVIKLFEVNKNLNKKI